MFNTKALACTWRLITAWRGAAGELVFLLFWALSSFCLLERWQVWLCWQEHPRIWHRHICLELDVQQGRRLGGGINAHAWHRLGWHEDNDLRQCTFKTKKSFYFFVLFAFCFQTMSLVRRANDLCFQIQEIYSAVCESMQKAWQMFCIDFFLITRLSSSFPLINLTLACPCMG